jgi:hypothetical protein
MNTARCAICSNNFERLLNGPWSSSCPWKDPQNKQNKHTVSAQTVDISKYETQQGHLTTQERNELTSLKHLNASMLCANNVHMCMLCVNNENVCMLCVNNVHVCMLFVNNVNVCLCMLCVRHVHVCMLSVNNELKEICKEAGLKV